MFFSTPPPPVHIEDVYYHMKYLYDKSIEEDMKIIREFLKSRKPIQLKIRKEPVQK